MTPLCSDTDIMLLFISQTLIGCSTDNLQKNMMLWKSRERRRHLRNASLLKNWSESRIVLPWRCVIQHPHAVKAYSICKSLTMTQIVIPYSRKFWRGIYFGGLAVLRAICQYFNPPSFLQYAVTWRHQYAVHNRSKCPKKASNFERMERK